MTARGIPLLSPDAFTVTQNDPEFSVIVAESLGNEITPDDGWDKDVDELMRMFDGGDDLLDGMRGHVPDSDFVDGDVDAGLLAPVATDTAQHIADGDPLFADVIDSATPPPPPPPPPPGGPGDCPSCVVCPPGAILEADGSCRYPDASA